MDLGWIVTYASPHNPTAQRSLSPADDVLSREQMRPYLSIEVDDVDAVRAAAASRGYEVLHPLTGEPWGVRRFSVVEPGVLVLNILGNTPLGRPRPRFSIGALATTAVRRESRKGRTSQVGASLWRPRP